MRNLWLASFAGLITLLAGCASAPRWQPHRSLLFDAVPGPISAGQILHRSDWPSYPRSSALRQEVFFSERVIDLQYTSGSSSHDRLYRRFDSVKIGHEYR